MTERVRTLTPTQSPIAEGEAPAGSSAAPAEPPHSLLARARRWLDAAGALLPAALLVFFSFQAGGFFPGSTGVAAAALALLLALRATLASHPFAPFNAPVFVVTAAVACFGAWVLASASWSDAPGRALIEFDRVLLYGLAFVTCATFSWSPRRLAWAVRWLVLGIFVVCLVGWASRVAPDVISLDVGAAADRLSQPLTYWNTQGLIAALGALFAFHLASSAREPGLSRALGAAAVPVLVSTLLLTFSRGAMLALLAGILLYVVLYRSRALLLGALAAGPPAAVALLYSYEADRLATVDSLGAQAVAQGHGVARAVAVCTFAAVLISVVSTRWLRSPLESVALGVRARRPVRAVAALGAVIALVVVPLALGAPDYASRQYDRFLDAGDGVEVTDQRSRLSSPGNNGRLEHWQVAFDSWQAHPVAGTGAGTYEHAWNRDRPAEYNVRDAHSLYLETLAELGLVGLVLLGIGLLTLGTTVLWRGQRRPRSRLGGLDPSLYAVFVGAFAGWAVHAGLDWIWETPAVTVWIFALGGMTLASRVATGTPTGPNRRARVVIGLGCLVLATVPVQIARSQIALDAGLEAFRASPQNCPKAIDASLESLAAIGARAEPWEIIAYCDVGQGERNLAVQAARNAVVRDPESWTYRYALALVQAVAGQDPRPAARQALVRNPRSQLAQRAVKVFERSSPRRWPRIARRLRLPRS